MIGEQTAFIDGFNFYTKKDTFRDVWGNFKVLSDYKFGLDYIDMYCNGYVAIAPFNNALMYDLEEFIEKTCPQLFHHCVCENINAYNFWVKKLHQTRRIKVFFIKENLNMYKRDFPTYEEFTGWLDDEDHFLHFCHNSYNHLVTGSAENYFDEPYNKAVVKYREKEYEKMSKVVDYFYDDLYELYNEYKSALVTNLLTSIVTNTI